MTERSSVNHGGGDGVPDAGRALTDPPGDLPAAPDTRVTPEVVASFRSQLTVGEDVVDPKTWAGSVPVAHGIAPRVRIGHSRWFNLLWLVPIGFVVLIIAVAHREGPA
jgi:sulfoxide reductase catalytic subunit YedY